MGGRSSGIWVFCGAGQWGRVRGSLGAWVPWGSWVLATTGRQSRCQGNWKVVYLWKEGHEPGLLGSYHNCKFFVRVDVGSFTPRLPGQSHGQGSTVLREAEGETPMVEAGKGVRNRSQRWMHACRKRVGEDRLEF